MRPAPLPVAPVPLGPATATAPEAAATPAAGHGFCSNCGAEHDLAAHYCEACGQPFATALPTEHHTV